MWLDDITSFAAEHRLTHRQARQRQCTAEHLVARCDGGKNTASNIVAACRECNSTRHRRNVPLSPLRWKKVRMKRAARLRARRRRRG